MTDENITITIPAGVLSKAQEMRLREDLKIHHDTKPTSDELHLIRSKVEAHLRVSGALEMPEELTVEHCNPEANTRRLIFIIEQQHLQEDGTWSHWLPVKLSDPYVKVKAGQRIRQRVGMRWETARFDGKIVEFQI